MGSKITQLESPHGAARLCMVAVMFVSTLNASFMQSLMNVALDRVATDFSITLSQANWVVLGYAIVTGSVITTVASLIARYGIRRVMFVSYVAAVAGSLLGFVAWSFPVMIVARLIQAITTGLTFPLVNVALLRLSPKGRAGVLLSLNSGVIGVGLAVAPLISGLILTYFGLHALFLLPAVVSAILLICAHFALHNLTPRIEKKIDLISVVFSTCALATFMYGLNDVTRNLLPSLALMLFSVVLAMFFVFRQRHLADPLLDLRPLRVRAFALGEVLVIVSYMGSVYLSLLAPLYLEGSASYTPFMAGCLLALPILCYGIFCFASGKILGKHGVSPLVPCGFAIMILGFGATFFAAQSRLVTVFLVCVAVAYGGYGVMYPSIKSVDLEVIPHAEASSGSSIHSTFVQIAGSVSSALFVGIMSSDVTSSMAAGSTKAAAYAFGFSHTLLIALGILIAGFLLSLVYVRAVAKTNPTSPK